jgi:hypothetical protein
MNTTILLVGVALIAVFGIAAMVGPAIMATQAIAQNMTGTMQR